MSCTDHRYSYKAAKHGPETVIPASRQTHDTQYDKMQGMELGGYVDREVATLCNILAACRRVLSLGDFLDMAKPLPASIPHGDFTRLQAARQHMHLYTHSVLLTMQREQLQPVAADVPCGSGHARLGTAVDIVAVRAHDPEALVLLELKCGFMRYLHKYQGLMCAPYERFHDCPLNQFHLQLALTEVLFRRTYPRAKLGVPLIINVHPGGCDVYPLNQAVRQCNAAAWQRLLETKLATATQRKHTRERQQRKARLAQDQWERNAKRQAAVVPKSVIRANLQRLQKAGFRMYTKPAHASRRASKAATPRARPPWPWATH